MLKSAFILGSVRSIPKPGSFHHTIMPPQESTSPREEGLVRSRDGKRTKTQVERSEMRGRGSASSEFVRGSWPSGAESTEICHCLLENACDDVYCSLGAPSLSLQRV